MISTPNKTILLQGSARRDGDTASVCDHLSKALSWDVVPLYDYTVHPYTYDHRHADDDFLTLLDHLLTYDTIALASPIYWYSMSAQLKAFIDRLTDLLQVYKPRGRLLRGKSMMAISVGHIADAPPYYFTPFRLTADYMGIHYLGNMHIDHNALKHHAYCDIVIENLKSISTRSV